MQKITSYLKLSTSSFLEFFVLKMISRRSHSIQEIYDELRSIGFRTPKGSLYPLLSSFRKEGSSRAALKNSMMVQYKSHIASQTAAASIFSN